MKTQSKLLLGILGMFAVSASLMVPECRGGYNDYDRVVNTVGAAAQVLNLFVPKRVVVENRNQNPVVTQPAYTIPQVQQPLYVCPQSYVTNPYQNPPQVPYYVQPGRTYVTPHVIVNEVPGYGCPEAQNYYTPWRRPGQLPPPPPLPPAPQLPPLPCPCR